ncbi:MAG TPA: hypothetical protein VJA94_22765, partial [Candidatus Angelobacter sp.]
LLRYFVAVTRDMYKALEIRPSSSEWSPENRMLRRVHNSFLVAFAGLEAGFLGLCYAFYLAQRH